MRSVLLSASVVLGLSVGIAARQARAQSATVDPDHSATLNVLPEGYRRPAEFSVDRKLSYDFSKYDMYLPNWFNGVQTTGDPSLVEWNEDGSATLNFVGHRKDGRSGMLQIIRPRKAKGRWGAIVQVTRPEAVAAFFLYSNDNGKEVDFELTRRDGVLGWSPNVYMPCGEDDRSAVTSEQEHMPFRPDELQKLEVELTDTEAVFYVDDEEAGRITPADLPDNCEWDVTTPVNLILSVESHGPWAGHRYEGGHAQMIVHAILP
ncbi:glycoside hydrolase family 16 protein [uncultured Paracoccus sp.]|uniref:glycoside hydrolase family 16 protein n=1 Tax=uncultured Paracoccus sp. TaxID=189685 RepID=UPI002627CF8A|nr:glycoside hydrolase family 16 protein [uncultured Paracoccus sp.]